MSLTQAIIYVPGSPETVRWLDQCVRYCTGVGYVIAAIVMDDQDGRRWADVIAMVAEGVQVVVVARADHLPPQRPGRIEVVADRHPPSGNGSRPRLRDAADRRPPPPSADR